LQKLRTIAIINMEEEFIAEKTFERKDFSKNGLEKGEYELCTFLNCNFSNTDLSNILFTDCKFYDCNLSGATIFQTGFQNIFFKDCKLLGLHFDKSNDFGFSIQVDHCQLNHSSFYKRKLSKTRFKKSKLEAVDFTACDLSFVFNTTNLQNADFRNSYNFTIDPENNRIKGAKFTLETVVGLLTKYNIKIEPNY